MFSDQGGLEVTIEQACSRTFDGHRTSHWPCLVIVTCIQRGGQEDGRCTTWDAANIQDNAIARAVDRHFPSTILAWPSSKMMMLSPDAILSCSTDRLGETPA